MPAEAILEVYQQTRASGTPAAGSRIVRRRLHGAGARLAVNLPELGRTVELSVSENGTYAVNVGPAPGTAGGFVSVFHGTVTEEV